jgi:hypothetical protein
MAARKLILLENSFLKYQILKKYVRQRSETNIMYLERHVHGEFHNLYQELRTEPFLFKEYCRMLPTTFDYIVQAIKPVLRFTATNFQRPISVEERLMVTLR